MQSAPVAAAGATIALFFPTIVRAEETAMFVDEADNVPLSTTTGLEPDLARPTPLSRLHTGAWTVPAFVSLHVAVPSVPT